MTTPITPPLDWLRSIQALFYPTTCSVLRYTETNTADGVSQDWAVHLAAVPCRVDTRRGIGIETTGMESSALRARSDWRIWLPFDTDVTVNDRVTVDAPDGRTFEVSEVAAKPTSYETTRLLTCVLIGEGA
jgi:head-tail adaptor